MDGESSWTALDPLRTSEVLVRINLRLRGLASSRQDVELVANLQKHYGLGIFKCKYLWCARSLRGFGTKQNLDTHKPDHQCRWQCLVPNCPSKETEFLTKWMLDEHIDLVHGQASTVLQGQVLITNTSFETSEMNNLQRTEIEAVVREAPRDTDADSDATLNFVRKMSSLPN